MISDVIQSVILMRGVPSEYDTVIEILTNRDKFPKLFDVFQAAKTTETNIERSVNGNYDIQCCLKYVWAKT